MPALPTQNLLNMVFIQRAIIYGGNEMSKFFGGSENFWSRVVFYLSHFHITNKEKNILNFDATGPVPADNMLTITICHTIGRRLDDVGKKTIRSDNIGPLPGG